MRQLCLAFAAEASAAHDLETRGHNGPGHVARTRYDVGTKGRAVTHVAIVTLVVDATIRV